MLFYDIVGIVIVIVIVIVIIIVSFMIIHRLRSDGCLVDCRCVLFVDGL